MTELSFVKELEKCAAAGDIPGMAKIIEEVHKEWDSLNDNMKKDIEQLEAVFLSLVNIKTSGDT